MISHARIVLLLVTLVFTQAAAVNSTFATPMITDSITAQAVAEFYDPAAGPEQSDNEFPTFSGNMPVLKGMTSAQVAAGSTASAQASVRWYDGDNPPPGTLPGAGLNTKLGVAISVQSAPPPDPPGTAYASAGASAGYSVTFTYAYAKGVTPKDPTYTVMLHGDVNLGGAFATISVETDRTTYYNGQANTMSHTETYNSKDSPTLFSPSNSPGNHFLIDGSVAGSIGNGQTTVSLQDHLTITLSASGLSSDGNKYSANFNDTFDLVSINLLDTAGNPIPGVTVTASDGLDYSSLINAVLPEPSALFSAFIGAAVLLAWCVVQGRRRPGATSL
jgi:hypothetical protein